MKLTDTVFTEADVMHLVPCFQITPVPFLGTCLKVNKEYMFMVMKLELNSTWDPKGLNIRLLVILSNW